MPGDFTGEFFAEMGRDDAAKAFNLKDEAGGNGADSAAAAAIRGWPRLKNAFSHHRQ
jgi:hypothetical protein